MDIAKGIIVDKCPAAGHTHCKRCGRRLPFHSLRVTASHYRTGVMHFHFHCFQMYRDRPVVFPESVEYRGTDAEEVKCVREWIEQSIGDLQLQGQPLRSLSAAKEGGTDSVLRRPLLEVFQYLSIVDIGKGAYFVSKFWNSICWSEELWKRKYLTDFKLDFTQADTRYHTHYLARVASTCRKCNRPVDVAQLSISDPLHARPLCGKCRIDGEGYLVPVKTYCSTVLVDPELIGDLGVPLVTRRSVKYACSHNLGKRMNEYVEMRKKALLTYIESELPQELSAKSMQFIQTTFIQSNYLNGSKLYSEAGRVLAKFLGRRDVKEQFPEDVRELVNGLKKLEASGCLFY